jgi:hypothetical protein
MRSKISIADYLYYISVKYEVNFDRLVQGLVLARENEEVRCGKLLIQCRQKASKYDVFLITNGYQVVAQFFISKYFFDELNQFKKPPFSHFAMRAHDQETHENPSNIRDLKYGMKRINLKARVLDVPTPTLVFTRFGEYAHVSNALIADETGTIKLCLWNEKINAVSVDSVIQIENASVTKFRGENQLKLGKNGKLSIIENTKFPA